MTGNDTEQEGECLLQEEILTITETLNGAVYDANRYENGEQEWRKKSVMSRLKESKRLIDEILEREEDTDT